MKDGSSDSPNITLPWVNIHHLGQVLCLTEQVESETVGTQSIKHV